MPLPAQNVIAPSGTIKLDRLNTVETNSAPHAIDALNNCR